MPIVITCGGCRKKLKIGDALVGKWVKCPGCARKLNTAVKKAPAKAAASGAKTPAKKVAAAVAVKKPASAVKPAPVPPAAIKKKPAPKPATMSHAAATAIEPAPDDTPPPPKPKPTLPPGFKPPARRPASDDDGVNVLVLLGGGVVSFAVLGFAIWYFFLAGAATTITGTITLDGKPVENVEMAFIPIEPAGLKEFAGGPTDAAGIYREFAIPGKYKVVLKKIVQQNGEPIPEGEEEDFEESSKNLFEIHGTAEKSTLTVTIKSGPNKSDFVLKSTP